MPFLQLLAIVFGFLFLKNCTGPETTPVVSSEERLREPVQAKIDTLETIYRVEKHHYHETVVRADQKLEQSYRKGQVGADTVIKSKNERIGKVETLLVQCDSLRGLDSLIIDSQKRELKPRNKYFVTAAATVGPLNNNLSIGGLLVTKKGYIFGYEKGVIQNTHSITIGTQIRFK